MTFFNFLALLFSGKHTILLSAVIMMVLASASYAQIPRQISYQGLLVAPNGTPISNGQHVIRIAIYDTPTATVDLFNETDATTTTNGLFNIIIGGTSPIPPGLDFGKPYWLGVSVDGGAEMNPRTPLTSVPYALHAEVADRANFISSDAKGVVTSINEVDGPIRIVGDSLTKVTQDGKVITINTVPYGIQSIQNIDGSMTIQNPNGPIVTLSVADSGITNVKLARNSVSNEKIQTGAVTGDKIAQMGASTLQVLKWNGTQWAPANDDTTGLQAGTGVIITKDVNGNNVIATTLIGMPPGTFGATLRHDGSNWISNTFLYNDGSRIGIGTTNPSSTDMLDLSGNLRLSNTANVSSKLSIQEPYKGGPGIHITSFETQTQPKDIAYTLPAAMLSTDAILSVNPNGVMSWQNQLPPSITTPFSQITSGINNGQDLQVGDTSILRPTGTGIIISNKLSGSSAGGSSYAGRIAVPMGTTSLNV
ncbi:MAG: hypothetical protein ABI778_09155, partial [Ignavibacteriota bacterium]